MSEFREFARESAALSVACLALVWASPLAGAIVPVATLAALGRDLWRKCPQRVTEAAIASVLADVKAAGIPAAHLDAARAALATLPSGAALDTRTLIAAARSGAGFDAALVGAILSHLPPGTSYDARALCETALATGLRTCRAHPEFRATLTEALVLETARDVGLVLQGVARVETQLHDLPDTLANLLRAQGFVTRDATAVSLDTLQAVADRFGDTDATDSRALIRFLDQKAQEYHSFRAQIDAIDERTAGLGNLKAAAKDAAARLDFAEVETLLARVDEVETIIAAETKELRADNALLRGRVEDAFRYLSAAADSFAGLDPLEPARRRWDYANRLYRHGLHYGGSGLELSAQMNTAALAGIDRDAAPDLWALTQNNLGNVLRNQGSRSSGAGGAAMLAEAVKAYRAVLEVYTRDAHPLGWAMTQMNLGNALSEHGSRTGGAGGAAMLATAAEAYRATLEVCTRDTHPLDWAMAQNNFGNALLNQSHHTGGAGGAALLAEAVEAYRAALNVCTRDAHPLDWAITQSNLGNALLNQSHHTSGPGAGALLAKAVAAYRAALDVRTRDAHPLDWAATLNNLGNAFSHQGALTDGPHGARLFAQAVAAFDAALEVRARDEQPVDWAMTQENLAIVYVYLSEHDTCTDPRPPLRMALTHVEAALTVFDPDHMPYNHAKATALREHIRRSLAP